MLRLMVMFLPLVLGAVSLAVVLSACSGGGAIGSSPDEQQDVSRAAVVPGGDGERMEALAIGTLRADPSTGCLWLESEGAEREVQVLLQGDYSVDFAQSPPAVLQGDSVLARIGERVELGGGSLPELPGVQGCPVTSDEIFLGYFF